MVNITNPAISVIVPSYNVAKYLNAALDSLRSQTLKNFEAIIVDDGSTDNTYDVAKSFSEQDKRFRVLHKPNGGLSSARNYGIRHSNANYIALLDADDIYGPRKLEAHTDILNRFSEVGLVYSASQAIRDDGKLTFIALSGKPLYKDPLLSLLCKNFIGHGSNAVFRKDIFEQVGEFDESLRSSEDVDFWLRIAAQGNWRFHRIPQKLSFYRVRPSGLSFNVQRMKESRTRVIQAAYQRSPEAVEPMLDTAYAYLYRYLARICMGMGDAEQAKYYLDLALEKDTSIFYKDPRSLVTLLAVKMSAMSSFLIKKVLGTQPQDR